MCKVRIVNKGNNYTSINSTSIEIDIPAETISILRQVFSELNKSRSNAICPFLSITEL